MKTLIDQFKEQFDSKTLLLGEQIGDKYCADWSGVDPVTPKAVLRPTDTSEVSTILRLCNTHQQAIVTQGGMTGLAGAATPEADEVALSLERMTGIEEIDTDSMTMTLWAGTPLQQAQEVALEAGCYLPLDLGARGSCTIGGNVSTNAGGNQVVRYGMTRELVLGMEAVLADGRVISSMNKVIKNNTGYDLKQLFIGSEGTLGVVTRVVLKLQTRPQATYTALCAAPDFKCLVQLFKHAQTELAGGVTAFEVMWSNYYDYILENSDTLVNPFSQHYASYALIQYQGADNTQMTEMFEGMLGGALEMGLLQDVLVAQSSREADTFWQIRDGIGEALGQLSPALGFDVSIPIRDISAFVNAVEQPLNKQFPEACLLLFGHIGDSNLHLAIGLKDVNDGPAISELVYQKVGQYQGSVSAEHGIGKLKKKYLPLSRSEEERNLMKQLKLALDPHQILNPGRIIEL